MDIAPVTAADLDDLLPLMRGYRDFYEASTADDELLAISRALIGDPLEGRQFIARESARAIGFATLYWTWSTLSGGRIGVMNDLFVAPEARGRRVGEALIEACRAAVRERGGRELSWMTAIDNTTAQALYDRVGGRRKQWYEYELEP